MTQGVNPHWQCPPGGLASLPMKVIFRLLRGLAAGVATALLVACGSLPMGTPFTAAGAAKPKLVVMIVIDGLPQWQVLAYRDQLAPDGFARFLA